MVQASFKKITKGASSKRIKKSEIPGSICLMPISIGQKYHIDEQGFATLKLLTESNFSKIIIIVVDELQALTIAAQQGCSLDQARQIALQRGDDWLEWFEQQKRVEPAIANLPIEIIRWSIYSEDQIRNEKAVVETWQTENYKGFRKLLGQTAGGFLKGAAGQMDDLDGARIKVHFDNSIEYLRRETAVAIKWQEQFVHAYAGATIFLAYPREPNPVIDFVLNKAESPYKLEVEVLVIRFDSPKLSAKKSGEASSAKLRKDEAEPTGKDEYLSSDSGGGTPPDPSFIEEAAPPQQMQAVQEELSSLREQIGAISALQQQVQTLNQHVLFLYQNYVVTGAGSNGSHTLPTLERRPSPPLLPAPAGDMPVFPPPAAGTSSAIGGTFPN